MSKTVMTVVIQFPTHSLQQEKEGRRRERRGEDGREEWNGPREWRMKRRKEWRVVEWMLSQSLKTMMAVRRRGVRPSPKYQNTMEDHTRKVSVNLLGIQKAMCPRKHLLFMSPNPPQLTMTMVRARDTQG